MYGFTRWNSAYCRELQEEEEAEEKELLSADRISMSAWKSAPSPNYNQNEDFFYPYSELDYVGEYSIVKLPFSPQKYIDHVDYWGEGRVVTEEGISGFPFCYNVNERHKLVSKGADVDRKIPNRIPVFSSTNCNTSDYIKNNSVKLVTVSGGRISRRCAKDVARIVARNEGLVAALGYDNESEDIKILEKALKKESLLHCPSRAIPSLLREVTAFSTRRMYVPIEHLDEELQRYISERNYEEAIKISRVFISNKYFTRIYNVVTKMLREGSREGHESVLCYAYWLWSHGERVTVADHLHAQFALVFSGSCVKISHIQYNLPLKFDKTDDVSTGIETIWKFLPIWENNNLSFKIQNVGNKQFLTLDSSKAYGKRRVTAGSAARELKFKWSVSPLLHDNNLLFYIVNKYFVDGLCMNTEIKQGERHVVSIEGSVNQPEVYGWKVEPVSKLH